ncbi:MAG TPA: hypothetical protein VF486_01085 [Actinomycetes bacterium]
METLHARHRPARDQVVERPIRDQVVERPVRDQVVERPQADQVVEGRTWDQVVDRGAVDARSGTRAEAARVDRENSVGGAEMSSG